MKNKKYWQERAVWNMYDSMEAAEGIADEVVKVYMQSSKYLQLHMESIFEKYKKEHRLSDVEARLLLENADSMKVQELIRKLENGEESRSKKELLAELEAPAYQARIERLDRLQSQIDDIMQRVYGQEQKISTAFYESLAKQTYYRSVFEVQKNTGVNFKFEHVSEKQISRALSMNWSGKHYSERIWKNTEGLAKELKTELLVSLITGRTDRETAEVIEQKFACGAKNARRLIRTESSFLYGELAAISYQECGIEKYQFLATLDLRTSKICRSMDMKIFALKERKAGINYPPMHPWCRSTTVAVIEDEDLERLKRSAYNPSSGRIEKVPASMTYEQWYEKYVKGNQEALNEEKAIKNQASDREQHERYRKVLGKDVPERFDSFQKMKYNEPERWKFTKLDYQRRTELLENPDRKLPNAENAILPEGKFTKYLLGGDIERGLAKGRAFTKRLGYSLENWKELQNEIQQGIEKYPAENKGQIEYGTKYEQKMILYGKKGTPANVIVGWLLKPDGSIAMTSAYIKEVTNK